MRAQKGAVKLERTKRLCNNIKNKMGLEVIVKTYLSSITLEQNTVKNIVLERQKIRRVK